MWACTEIIEHRRSILDAILLSAISAKS